MVVAGHVKEWPDKIIFAAMVLLFGSLLGLLFDAARLAGATVGGDGLAISASLSPYYTLTMESLGIVAGAISVRFQSARYLYIGALAGIASMGFFLLVPFCSLISLAFVARAKMEGEEIKHDEHTMDASLWPDKALAAALTLTLGGLVTLLHGIMLLMDNASTWGLEASWLAPVTLAGGLFVLWSARQCYRLRHPVTGWISVLVLGALGAFAVVGVALGGLAFLLLALADKEEEFSEPTQA